MLKDLSREEYELYERLVAHLLKGADECGHMVSAFSESSLDVRSMLQRMLIAGDIKADQLRDEFVLSDQSQITIVDK
jgi:hypothetical protein